MALLTSEERKKLPDSAFALPSRRYPVHDLEHAKAALARVSANGSSAEKAVVRRAVHKRYPKLDLAEKSED